MKLLIHKDPKIAGTLVKHLRGDWKAGGAGYQFTGECFEEIVLVGSFKGDFITDHMWEEFFDYLQTRLAPGGSWVCVLEEAVSVAVR